METISGKQASKIGIGSYGVGGRGHRDMEITECEADKKYIDALVYALEEGSNFTEISIAIGRGRSLSLFKQALGSSSLSREDVFLTDSFYPRDLPDFGTMQEDLSNFYKVMKTDYADSTLVTQSLIIRFGETPVRKLLEQLLDQKRTRYVSLSNASPSWIKKFHTWFGEKFVAHEGHLSFEIRALQDKGVFSICERLGVENIIWRPLRRKSTLSRNWPLLVELSEKYKVSQSAVILNWIARLGYRSMVFSANPKHIGENLASLDFKMSEIEYDKMNEFRPDYQPPEVDWEGEKIDEDIVGLVKAFDDQVEGKEVDSSTYWKR
jgi:diketogulonate reductase-like aldo/keto reductase